MRDSGSPVSRLGASRVGGGPHVQVQGILKSKGTPAQQLIEDSSDYSDADEDDDGPAYGGTVPG